MEKVFFHSDTFFQPHSATVIQCHPLVILLGRMRSSFFTRADVTQVVYCSIHFIRGGRGGPPSHQQACVMPTKFLNQGFYTCVALERNKGKDARGRMKKKRTGEVGCSPSRSHRRSCHLVGASSLCLLTQSRCSLKSREKVMFIGTNPLLGGK